MWFLSFAIDFEAATWDDKLDYGLRFLTTQVLQLPFVLMTLMKHMSPALDNMSVAKTSDYPASPC
jgi:hypothetical protein